MSGVPEGVGVKTQNCGCDGGVSSSKLYGHGWLALTATAAPPGDTTNRADALHEVCPFLPTILINY